MSVKHNSKFTTSKHQETLIKLFYPSTNPITPLGVFLRQSLQYRHMAQTTTRVAFTYFWKFRHHEVLHITLSSLLPPKLIVMIW